jgi:hypothetical protein
MSRTFFNIIFKIVILKDEKLMNFYKKGIPEIALAGMFKVNIKIIRERILKILK